MWLTAAWICAINQGEFARFHQPIKGDRVNLGDSGGPVYRGSDALGIVTAINSKWAYFTPMEVISDHLNTSVYTP